MFRGRAPVTGGMESIPSFADYLFIFAFVHNQSFTLAMQWQMKALFSLKGVFI